MTTIHSLPSATWHFPSIKHESLYWKDGGWIIKPEETLPSIWVSDDKNSTTINIHIPGIHGDKIQIGSSRGYLKQISKVNPMQEIVHIIFPKRKSIK